MKKIGTTVNWGIIGCGDVCEVKSGPAFNKVPNSKLVAVMRRDEAKAADFAKRHGVPKFYSDASKLINDPGVNAIYIATPPSTHAPYMEEALKAGKPVYVEKPVTLSADLCRKMINTKNQLDGFVSVAHYRRQLPLFRKVKELIAQGAIGRVTLMTLTTLQPKASKIITQTADNWRVQPDISGGGLFNDLSPHQLDIAYWLFGKPLKVNGRSLNQAEIYNAPDLATLGAEFQNKVVLNGVWAFNVGEAATRDVCEIVGSEGFIRFSFFRKSTIEVNGNVLEMDYPENIQQPMIDAVTKFFRGEGENPCSLEDALTVMEMIDSANHS
ncbi:MAG TPA: Gfo/Idh/MocA family oxidoreductase [Cyclobacteriaceae bacterium]|nr:Gfo/Idh/MocA family oxidoreductase [Cyclobacteriaceae bacterium]